MKGSPVPPPIEDLLQRATARNVKAHHVPIETFDAFLLRLWRNIESKPAALDTQVRKSRVASAHIPLPASGTKKPILRLNGLPVLSVPKQCIALTFRTPKDWQELHQAQVDSSGQLILTISDSILCWGRQDQIRKTFSMDIATMTPCDLPGDLSAPQNLHVRGFVEKALGRAIVRGKPLLYRTIRHRAYLIADPHTETQSELQVLRERADGVSGVIPGLFAPVTDDHPRPEKVTWAEAARISVDCRNGKLWLLIDPDLWIWPPRGRQNAAEYMDKRRSDRRNEKYNRLLDAWVRLILGTDQREAQVSLTAFEGGLEFENPAFLVGSRTAYTRRLS
jgi:hypothetical protein